MDSSYDWIWIVLVLGLIVLVNIVIVQSQIAAIRDYLRDKGARRVYVYWLLSEWGRSSNGYEVHYEDAEGHVHVRNCVMRGLDSAIYWKDEE